jgi:hypothetical protein
VIFKSRLWLACIFWIYTYCGNNICYMDTLIPHTCIWAFSMSRLHRNVLKTYMVLPYYRYTIIAQRWGRYDDLWSDQTNINQDRRLRSILVWSLHKSSYCPNRLCNNCFIICLNIGSKLVKRSLPVRLVLISFWSHLLQRYVLKKKPTHTV